MAWGAYEGLVGWRYLLRQRRRPGVLIIGLIILALGAGVVAWGVNAQTGAGGSVSVFGNQGGAGAQVLMGVGGGIAALGACLSLFGALNLFLTVFAAFSTFMITIGVAEVILVLAVMNGFQGDLRTKIIDTHAHVIIEAAQRQSHLADYRRLTEEALTVPGVVGATPVLTAEVMISAPTNLAAVVLTGIDIETIGSASKLPTFLQQGDLRDLVDPDRVDARASQLRLRPKRRPSPGELALDALDEPDALRGSHGKGGPDGEDAPDGAQAPGPADLGEMAFPTAAPGLQRPPPSILMGNELRKNLALWPAEPVNVVSPFGELGPQGPVPKSRPFRLSGWFSSGMLEYDTKLAYASIGDVQRFLALEDVASAIQVRVHDLEAARGVRDALQAKLGAAVRVSDWQERNFNLFSALKLEKIAMFLVLTINILLAAFSITGTLVMTIIERKREIAILGAMGSSPAAVVRIFMSQGGFTGVLGSALGAAIGVGAAFALSTLRLPLDNDVYYITAIPVELRVADVLTIIAVAVAVSLVSTLYPARYAAGLRPIEGLKA